MDPWWTEKPTNPAPADSPGIAKEKSVPETARSKAPLSGVEHPTRAQVPLEPKLGAEPPFCGQDTLSWEAIKAERRRAGLAAERALLGRALSLHQWSPRQTARALGTNPGTLYNRLKAKHPGLLAQVRAAARADRSGSDTPSDGESWE